MKAKLIFNKKLLLIFPNVLVVCFLIFSLYFYIDYQKFPAIVPISGKNALWARHQWVGEQHNSEEYRNLTQLLKDNKITDVFFHVGPLNVEGKIEPEKYLFAKDLIVNLKKDYPELHIQAWIGQVERKGGGILDLSKTEVKKNVVETANDFLSLGFDGIHYNIEPVYSHDKNFIELLVETKKTTSSQNKILSVASDELELFWGAEGLARTVSKQAGFWDEPYYREVASNVDQIAVMMYDTALPFNWMYAKLVSWETKRLINIIDSKVTLFMGVPTYEDKRWSFHPSAENIDSALRGIKKGLVIFPKDQMNFGVAIYAEWTTDKEEWNNYKRNWLGE